MSTNEGSGFSDNFELICGLILAILAAVLAVNDLGAGKFGDDEMIAVSEKANAYAWYSSKGVKQDLAEGQRDLLTALASTGAIADTQRAAVEKTAADLQVKIDRYKKEMKEIQVGSEAVGQENWAQEVDGKMGQITGAAVHERIAVNLGLAGDKFDLGTLFLQLSLVIGAISLIMKKPVVKKFFLGGCVLLGVIGTVFCVIAYGLATAA